MKVIVCQHGARRRYAVARILEEAGMLEALYTDSCEYSLLGRTAKACPWFPAKNWQRLANRRIANVPEQKIRSSDLVTYYSHLSRLLPARQRERTKWTAVLSRKMKRWGVGSDHTIYNMYCENIDFLEHAKAFGTRIICDVYVNPLSNRIVRDEYASHAWLKQRPITGIDSLEEEDITRVFALSDVLLCPSEWVADGVKQLTPQYSEKIRLCAYGSTVHYGGAVNKPIPGRIFWAGTDAVRKGLHYLAEAANSLKTRYPELDFRAAGITDQEYTNSTRFRNIHFLGRLNDHQMREEFLTADMFVFPTLSEGMAGVVVEALAAGCPVITSRSAGVDRIEDGKSGLLVAPRDSESVVRAIVRLHEDQRLRDNIAAHTAQVARAYSMEAWAQRLVKAVSTWNYPEYVAR